MRNLQEHANYCMEILDNLHVPYNRPTEFKINTRAKKRWGQCKYDSQTGTYAISINVDLLDERNEEYGLHNTILHELLHTIKGCMNHGKKWKRYADMVSNSTGYIIQRTGSAEEEGFRYRRETPVNYRWKLTCTNCGQEYFYQRTSKAVKNPNRFHCGCCHGSLKVERID